MNGSLPVQNSASGNALQHGAMKAQRDSRHRRQSSPCELAITSRIRLPEHGSSMLTGVVYRNRRE